MEWRRQDKPVAQLENEDGTTGTATDNLTYNTSWANNPLCNLDLNTLIAPFDDGIFMGYAELLGLFGKRSQHMLSGYATTGGNQDGEKTDITVEYNTDGFVTKITATNGGDDGDMDKDVYTITYR